MIKRSGKISNKLSGCHFIDKELVKSGNLQYEITKNGFIKEVTLYCDGISAGNKTIFPIGWSKANTIIEIAQSIKKFANSLTEAPPNQISQLETFLNDNIKIITIIDKQKRFVTSFPLAEK